MNKVQNRFLPAPRFTWPDGHRCAAMLCFDVDGETTALSEDPALARRRTLMSQCEYGPRIGVPGVYSTAWYGLMAPAGVPQEVVTRVNTELNAVLKSPDVRKKIEEFGGGTGGVRLRASEFRRPGVVAD